MNTHEASDARPWDGLILGASLATLDGEGYGAVTDGALGWRDGVITYAGPRDGLPGEPDVLACTAVEASGWITPGLVDCHTHLVFAGDRAREFEMRLEGASYEDIARAGAAATRSPRRCRHRAGRRIPAAGRARPGRSCAR